MSHMQPHSTRRTAVPRAHRNPLAHRAARSAWHAHIAETASAEPEMAGAQAVFYIARGVAVLLAALSVGLGAPSNDAEPRSTAYPSSSQATAR